MVDAKTEQLKQFYAKYGFEPLPERPLRLFIKVASIKKTWPQMMRRTVKGLVAEDDPVINIPPRRVIRAKASE
jgi:hypothetical protein